MNISILSGDEKIRAAIDCFARGIERHWSIPREEAGTWVQDEFLDPTSKIIGAHIRDRFVGVCSLVSLQRVLQQLPACERQCVRAAIADTLRMHEGKIIFTGGLAVEEAYEGRGITHQLASFLQTLARAEGYGVLLGHSARPTPEFPQIRALTMLLEKFHFKTLPLPQKYFYPVTHTMEKVWVYKEIQ